MGRRRRERLITHLREHGLKLTPQRLAIIELLEKRGHYSVEEIYTRLKRRYPMLSRATVYNTLEILQELGEVRELKIKPHIALYEPATEPHYHFFCRRCGKVIDVEPLPECDLKRLPRSLATGELKDYKIEGVQVYLYGICSGCSRGEGKEKRKKGGEEGRNGRDERGGVR